MKYTNYFALITKEKGPLNLSAFQFKRMMNIVYLEGSLNGLNKIKESLKNTEDFHKYDMLIFKENRRLTDLSNNSSPEVLVGELIRLSVI